MSIQNGTSLTKEALEYLVGLIRDISRLDSKLIDDINLKTNGTYSSVRIKSLIDKNLEDANTHTEDLISALNKLSSKKTNIQPTLENSEFNVIYLYSTDGNAPFEQYLKIGANDSDAELISLGSTNISLDEYLTVLDASQTYAKQVDLDATNNTLSNHIDNTDVHVTAEEKEQFKNKIDKGTVINTEPTSSGAVSQFMVCEDAHGNNFGGMNFVTSDGIGRRFGMSDYEDHVIFVKSNGGTGVEERHKILDERDVPFKLGVNSKGEYGYIKEGESEIIPFKSGADFESFAPTYEETETYNTKSLVLYNDNLYECLENNVTGTFNITKWKKVNIPDINNSNSDMNIENIGSTKSYNAAIGDIFLVWVTDVQNSIYGAIEPPLAIEGADVLFTTWTNHSFMSNWFCVGKIIIIKATSTTITMQYSWNVCKLK